VGLSGGLLTALRDNILRRMRIIIGAEIGRGGFCVVHQAQQVDDIDNAIGPPLAIKTLKPEAAKDPVILARFQREARLLQDSLSHPNIVSVVHRDASADQPWFVMPRADGNLEGRIADGAWRDEDWVIRSYRQVLKGMAYAHDNGVIHRDLKPGNGLVYGGVIKVSDFGLGKSLIAGTVGLTKTNTWSGTEPYMAPEQWTHMKETETPCDVFALGKLLMEMLTGNTPDVGIPDVHDVNQLPDKYRYFVTRCCASKPENRFRDAGAALEAFDRIVAEPVFAELAVDTLKRLIEEWFVTEPGDDLAITRDIDAHLRSNPNEEAMFTREIPKLPEDLVNQYMDEMPNEFVDMIRIYDRHVSGGLVFDYCDVVANFYVRLFRRTNRLDLREIVFTRLMEMGYSHNRWHVRGSAMNLLANETDPSTIAMEADVIRADPRAAGFLGEVASGYTVPKAVKEAFDAAAQSLRPPGEVA
jgi:serine/threonine protein kinase